MLKNISEQTCKIYLGVKLSTIDFSCLNDNGITHLGQTETSGVELSLYNLLDICIYLRIKKIKIQRKKEIKKKDTNIKLPGLPKIARLEKRTNLILKLNIWQEPQRGAP